MTQIDMELPFVSGSRTSEAAAESMKPTAESLRIQVLQFLEAMGGKGATDEEIQYALQMPGNTERPRRRELELAGFITKNGHERQTNSGRWAVVWVTK